METFPKGIRIGFFIAVACLITNVVLMGLLLGGGYGQMNVMAKTTSNMDMRMEKGEEAINTVARNVMSKFPNNQLEVTMRQVFGMIEDGKKIGGRTNYLLENINPKGVADSITNVNKFLGAVKPEEIQIIKRHAMSMIERLDSIVATIPPEKVASLLTTISALDTDKINQLIDTVGKLHELKIMLQ